MKPLQIHLCLSNFVFLIIVSVCFIDEAKLANVRLVNKQQIQKC